MKTFLKLACGLSLLTAASAPAQLMTWVQGSGNMNRTNVLAANQVMEILTMATDNSTALEVTVNDQMVSFGGGVPRPTPFVIAGPATVVFRRTSSGGTGSIITYRLSQSAPVSGKPTPAN